MRSLFFFMLIYSNFSFGQDSSPITQTSLQQDFFEKTHTFSIGSSFIYHPIDFFQSLEVKYKTTYFSPSFALAFGINRSVFQQRLFPSTQVYLPFTIISRVYRNQASYWGIGPQINTYFVKINKSSKHHQFWHEYLLSYRYEYGRKWNFVHQTGFGYRFERYFSELNSNFKSVGTWSYFITIGFNYKL